MFVKYIPEIWPLNSDILLVIFLNIEKSMLKICQFSALDTISSPPMFILAKFVTAPLKLGHRDIYCPGFSGSHI